MVSFFRMRGALKAHNASRRIGWNPTRGISYIVWVSVSSLTEGSFFWVLRFLHHQWTDRLDISERWSKLRCIEELLSKASYLYWFSCLWFKTIFVCFLFVFNLFLFLNIQGGDSVMSCLVKNDVVSVEHSYNNGKNNEPVSNVRTRPRRQLSVLY